MANSTWTKNHVDCFLVSWLYQRGEQEEEEGEDSSTSTHALSPADEDSLCQQVPNLAGGVHVENDGVQALRRKKRKFMKATVVYPPCNVESFAEFPVLPQALTVLSISQFRPEKEQVIQIRAFAQFVAGLDTHDPRCALVRLVLAGSCRDCANCARVNELILLAQSLGVAHAVSFKVNISWDKLKELLKTSLIGISTMVDEHFGISIVEFMVSAQSAQPSALLLLSNHSDLPLLLFIVVLFGRVVGFFIHLLFPFLLFFFEIIPNAKEKKSETSLAGKSTLVGVTKPAGNICGE
jgi:glycosyltransferase involved in cell wall biosynthesis